MAATWWAAVQLLGLAALPTTLRVFRWLPDRGWQLARPVGLLLVAFVYWHAAGWGFGNTRSTVLGALLVVALASWVVCRREARCVRGLVAARRWELAIGELLFACAFAGSVFVRAYTASLVSGEKAWELAMLTGVLHSPAFPPFDPWFAGRPETYYYYGYVVTAAIAHAVDVPVEFAFNLMLATVFALAAAGAFGLGLN